MQMNQRRKRRKNEIIIDLDNPISGRKPWNLLLLIAALFLVFHAMSWMILTVRNEIDDSDRGTAMLSRLQYFVRHFLTASLEFASGSFTIALACYCMFLAYIRAFPQRTAFESTKDGLKL